jgi:Ca2+-binding RTX toxin-like protein
MDGAGGADMLVGGIGDDTYYVDDPADRIVENAGEGADIALSASDYALSPNIEKLTQTGTGNIAATGNDLANTMNGNAGDNVLHGGNGGDLLVGNDGNDSLFGDAANDSLQGGTGNDTLVGGSGADQLTGGAGQDNFVLDSLTVSSDFDTIKDFALTDDSMSIASSAFAALTGLAGGVLPASAFKSGTQATTIDQHLIYNSSTGNLYYDPDGNGSGSMVQIAFFSTKPALSAANFTVT